MRSAVLFSAFAIAVSCSVTTPTPSGTVVASFKATESRWAELASAAPKASGISEGTFGAASAHGASVSVRYKTGIVELSGKPHKVPLEATVTVTDSRGFAISGGFSDGPLHYAGMPDDVRALDFHAQVSSGTRSCRGTSYENDSLRVRIFGDGTAKLLSDPVPVTSVAPPR